MGHLKIKVNECSYQNCDRQLQEQFTSDINDKAVTSKIVKELTTVKKTSEVTSQHVLAWAKREEA